VGGAGISLIGVEGAELAVLAEPLAELETLSLESCFGGGPEGLFDGSAGTSPLAKLLLLEDPLIGLVAAALTKLPIESDMGSGTSGSTMGSAIEKISENPAAPLSSFSCSGDFFVEAGGGPKGRVGPEGGAGPEGGGGPEGLVGGGPAGLAGGAGLEGGGAGRAGGRPEGRSGFSTGGAAGLAGGGPGLGGGGAGLGGGGFEGGTSSSLPIDGMIISPNSSKDSWESCDKLCLFVSLLRFCKSFEEDWHRGIVLAEHISNSSSNECLQSRFFKLMVKVCPQTSIEPFSTASRANL
jgi:hypothetical protein